jgi:hypothetical protein
VQTISNQEIKLKVQVNGEEREYTLLPIDIYEEFEIDKYFNKIIKAFQDESSQHQNAFDFIVFILGSMDEVLKFIALGKKVIAEFIDTPLFEIATRFSDIIVALQLHRQELKKK